MTEVDFEQYSGKRTLGILDEIADMYTAIKSDDPDGSDPIFSRSSFISRIEEQARDPEFQFVGATAHKLLVGFSFGYPFRPGRWWADSTPAASRELLEASKFAVIELDVRKEFRGRGLSKELLRRLLAGRTEEFATLAAIPGTQAHGMYLRWGWQKAAMLGGDGPAMDALLLPLSSH
jgi:GNAT superfamily N-acetyltransferase